MTKRKSSGERSRSPSDGSAGRTDKRRGEAPSTSGVARHLPSPAAIRETIESIVIAFVLAFLFRTFEAEAFVIPTGSMAPTLMGRHKDVLCPKCGCPYQVGASEEVNPDGVLLDSRYSIDAGTCPMCRYTANLGPDNSQHLSYPSYNGDRILVAKFAYQLADPKRWDVIVFKFPGDATTDSRTNFIKRLAGLPGDTVRIQHGDVWIRRGNKPFEIARKPPEKLLAMLQPVFDNDYMPRIAEVRLAPTLDARAVQRRQLARGVEPGRRGDFSHRWHGRPRGLASLSSPDSLLSGLVERPSTSRRLRQRTCPPNTSPTLRPTIRVGTPNGARRRSGPEADALGNFWVGDLALRCTVDIESSSGELIFELRKGGRQFLCRLKAATGQASLSVSGQGMESFRPTATTSVRGPGRHEILFSNCDDELRLWVDGRVVLFDASTAYDDLGNTLPHPTDLSPVGVASQGAKVRLSHLAIFRDIYYTANPSGGGDERLRNRTEQYLDYTLKADQFFALGDNSARSKDGRAWGPDNYWVPRELLIGKALFIYWPHSWNKIPYVNVPFPFFPNFSRMGLVRWRRG